MTRPTPREFFTRAEVAPHNSLLEELHDVASSLLLNAYEALGQREDAVVRAGPLSRRMPGVYRPDGAQVCHAEGTLLSHIPRSYAGVGYYPRWDPVKRRYATVAEADVLVAVDRIRLHSRHTVVDQRHGLTTVVARVTEELRDAISCVQTRGGDLRLLADAWGQRMRDAFDAREEAAPTTLSYANHCLTVEFGTHYTVCGGSIITPVPVAGLHKGRGVRVTLWRCLSDRLTAYGEAVSNVGSVDAAGRRALANLKRFIRDVESLSDDALRERAQTTRGITVTARQ